MTALGHSSHATGLVPGSVEAAYEVAHLAAERERVASDLLDRLLHMREIDGWTGQAAEAYANRVAGVARRWTEIGDGLSAVIDPLQTYARALSSAQGLAAQAIEAWAFASTLPETPGTPAGFSSFSRGWPVLVSDPRHRGPAPTTAGEARARAEAMVADACADVKAAGDVATVAVRRAIEAVRARGEAWAEIGESLGVAALPPGRVLAMTRTLDPETLAALLGARPDLLKRLAQTNPADVAPWWRGLNPAQQDALIACAPGIIGNLGGVAYAARDRANRIVLAQALEEARNSPWDQSEQVAALEALDRAATGNTLASLVLDRPPLAQVAVGDLDRASHVSVIVPGMGTTVGNDIESYVRLATHLRNEEDRASELVAGDFSVVAWVGYHPPMPDTHATEVFADARAEVGARALARDLDALRENSRECTGFELSVIAHSYGTDVATLALEGSDADRLVLLGSAGIADQVQSVAELRVPGDQVFASQARADGWAPIGQLFSTRTDPTVSEFGAQVFSSESAVVDGEKLLGVNRHGPFGAETAGEASYFTPNTTSMRNIVLALVGADDQMIMGGNVEDREITNGSRWEG